MFGIRKVVGGLVLLALLCAAGMALAQGIRIGYGDSVEGAISDAVPVIAYEFEGRAGEVIAVEMTRTSGDLDTLLEVVGANGQVIASNDDIDSGNRNSRIAAATLPADGLYTIRATRYSGANGISVGGFRLTLTLVSSAGGGQGNAAGVGAPPTLDVPYQQIAYEQTVTGQIADDTTPRYYLFAGTQGDLVSAHLTPTGGGIVPVVRFYDTDLNELSRSVTNDDGSASVYLAITTTGWYLVEAASQGGGGSYSLWLHGFSGQLIAYGDTLAGQVTDTNDGWYVFQARHGDTVSAQMTATSGNLSPYIVLADVNLNDLAYSTVGRNPATLTYTIPRTGTYVLLASRENLGDGTTAGAFTLVFNGTPINPATLNAQPLGYGRTAQGNIDDAQPIAYYTFQGKGGDIVTITMSAADPARLDPYLILTDSAFNELMFNDNTSADNSAQIFQYILPANDLYYIFATRPNLRDGTGSGEFTLELIAGEVQLTAGAVEATVRWDHTGDVDLFVQDPNGDIVGWDTPHVASGGTLEVDTNGNCVTVTSLPVEHVYWPQGVNLPGVYHFYVWYQLDCENRGATTFDLTVLVGGQQIARITDQLERGQRYEMSVTVNPDGSAYSNNDGQVVTPQQTAQDIAIGYGQTVTGTITNDQFVVYYRFNGLAGDRILVTANRVSGDLDPLVALLDAQDEVVASDDDSGGNRNARLEFTLPAAGEYVIAVTRYQVRDGTTTGDFTMSLSRTN